MSMQATQHIKGQIAHMKPENFIFHVKLFLGITNNIMDKRKNRFRKVIFVICTVYFTNLFNINNYYCNKTYMTRNI